MTATAPDDAVCRMTLYELTSPGEAVALPGGVTRFFYVEAGSFAIRSAAGGASVATDQGAFAQGAVTLEGEGTAWIYEVTPADHTLPEPPASLVLSRLLRPGFPRPWLIRADRVESPPGSSTPRHGHRGPGIRRLVRGCILAEIGEEVDRIETGRAWFETGRDWVVGTNVHDGMNVFVRVMILPNELEGGKSSFVPANAEEAAKPRSVAYRLFGETVLNGPSG